MSFACVTHINCGSRFLIVLKFLYVNCPRAGTLVSIYIWELYSYPFPNTLASLQPAPTHPATVSSTMKTE